MKGKSNEFIVFVGVGVFYFNPKADFQGQTYNLRDYHTEGQGYVPTRKNYSTFQLCIPLGIGFKYTIDRQWGLGLEFGIRKTFTDYIDDVSTTYIDLSQYQTGDQYDVGQFLSNPSDRSDPAAANTTAPGQQRGDPRYKDSYMFAIFSVNYKIKTGRNNLPRF